jgi:hypothetical protein
VFRLRIQQSPVPALARRMRETEIGLVGAERSKLHCRKEERTLRDRLGSRRALHDGKKLSSPFKPGGEPYVSTWTL